MHMKFSVSPKTTVTRVRFPVFVFYESAQNNTTLLPPTFVHSHMNYHLVSSPRQKHK